MALWGNETEIATIATSNGAAVYTDVKFGQKKDEKMSQNQLKHTATKFIIRREQKEEKKRNEKNREFDMPGIHKVRQNGCTKALFVFDNNSNTMISI